MQVKHYIVKSILHYRQTTSTVNYESCARVESANYFAWKVLSLEIQHDFVPYIKFYLHCKCSMFLGACTHRNAMKCSIEICLLCGWKEEIILRCVQLLIKECKNLSYCNRTTSYKAKCTGIWNIWCHSTCYDCENH